MNKKIEDQIIGARNIFFGFLKGIDNKFNIKLPDYVYHYTSKESFFSMVESDTLRMYTIGNFEDKLERRISFDIEGKVKGTITNKKDDRKYDFSSTINSVLSDDHVFIQSNTTTRKNQYLWKNYGSNGQGICLRISVKDYILFLEENLDDFDLLPNYLKCCFVSYNNNYINEFMKVLSPILQDDKSEYSGSFKIIWFFFLEYWKNFMKTPEPYEKEEEFRFVVSDNYSLFLFFCSKFSQWGIFATDEPNELSEAFFQEYKNRKDNLQKVLGFTSTENSCFVTIPFSKIVKSVIIGPNSTLTKSDVSHKTNYKIKKSQIERALS